MDVIIIHAFVLNKWLLALYIKLVYYIFIIEYDKIKLYLL